jgi:hypothetical protein
VQQLVNFGSLLEECSPGLAPARDMSRLRLLKDDAGSNRQHLDQTLMQRWEYVTIPIPEESVQNQPQGECAHSRVKRESPIKRPGCDLAFNLVGDNIRMIHRDSSMESGRY